MCTHFADRLLSAIERKGAPACVGFDPQWEKLPPALLNGAGPGGQTADAVEAIETFGRGVIEVIAAHVPAVKINIAFFEPYQEAGIGAYRRLVAHARAAGLIVIGDIKRADIGHSAARYAEAHLGAEDSVDAVTVNAYFGIDGVRPFIATSGSHGRGVFVLVQTSNPSAALVQGIAMQGGACFVEHIAEMVQAWAVEEAPVGDSGYSCVGAVVSPRDVESTRRIRTLMPNCLFLVPGFGAQGRTADEVATCFRPDGTGALVTASRSVIYADSNDPGRDWKACVDDASRDLVTQIRRVLRPR